MYRSISTCLALMLVFATVFTPPARAGAAGPIVVWDTRDTTQAGQLTIYNDDPDGTALGEPVGSGDFDGDGYDDVVTCAFYGPAGPADDRRAAGKLHLWFGGPDVLDGGVIYDAAAPTAPTVEIWGARPGDFLGNEIDAGDVNGDGLDDMLVCAQNADGFGADRDRVQAGVLYVILGREDWSGPIDLAASPEGVVEILGAFPGDRCGFWGTTGDVTGDGMRDIVVAADLSRGPNGDGDMRGAVYVVPGRTNLPSRIDLGDPDTVDDLGVVAIYGIDADDHFGSSVTTGDFDGDGHVDVAVGAGLSRGGAGSSDYGESSGQGTGGADGPDEDREDAGETYIVFGRESWPAEIQLADPPSADVTILYGNEVGDAFGEEVRAADVDGDGKDELAVGALLASPPPDRFLAGIGYLFWGGTIPRGARIDTRTAGGDQLTQVYGQAEGDIGADTLLLADVNGDGLADVIFGSPTNSPFFREFAGDLKVIYGSRDRFPAVVDTAAPPPDVPVYRAIADEPADLFTYSITVGDVDGDGVNDLIPNAMAGDGRDNEYDTAGDAYVISGKAFFERATVQLTPGPVLSRVTVEPDLNRYFAGQNGIVLSLFSDATDPDQQFEPGAEAILSGAPVPTEFVSSTELRVRLDDAPDVRNTAGPIDVQVRNPGSEPSGTIPALTLIGPTIRKAKITAKGDGYTIKIKGRDFREGATVELLSRGQTVPVISVERRNAKKIEVQVAGDAVTSGAAILVTVLNPGPAPSNLTVVRVP